MEEPTPTMASIRRSQIQWWVAIVAVLFATAAGLAWPDLPYAAAFIGAAVALALVAGWFHFATNRGSAKLS
jgi:hypothetical protein